MSKEQEVNIGELAEKVDRLEEIVEDILEEVEIEEWGKRNECPPHARRYVIRIDKTRYTVHVSHMTGRQLLELGQRLLEHLFAAGRIIAGNREAAEAVQCERQLIAQSGGPG